MDTGKPGNVPGGSGRVRPGGWVDSQKAQAVVASNPVQSKSRRVKRNIRGLLRDVAKIVDLQFQLLAVDLQDMWVSGRIALVAVIGACVVGITALPIVFVGLAYLLHNLAEWSEHAAFLTVGGAFILLSLIVIGLGGYKLMYALKKIDRSKEELKTNIAWIKEAANHEV